LRILIIGSGGREHAIAETFSRSPKVVDIFVSPGNAGIGQYYSLLPFISFEETVNQVREYKIDMVFIGPEQYLADGIVDYLEEHHIKVIGPSQKAARLESSKIFAKNMMQKLHIPTASHKEFHELDEALKYSTHCRYPQVIKADGLAAGKGVIIAQSPVEAKYYLDEMMNSLKYGNAGKSVIMEEFLEGWEASVFAFCDGIQFQTTIFAQDHKRLLDNDKGPNTGGMGAYAPILAAEVYRSQVNDMIFKPIFNELSAEGYPFRGILYAGLMMTKQGPKVIEFNCRLGDPETEVILPLLKTDLCEICEKMLQGQMDEVTLEWNEGFAVGVVAAASGYPEANEKGVEIQTLRKLETDTHLYYSGVSKQNDKLVTNGGRVLCLTAVAEDMDTAIAKVYHNLDRIYFDRWQYRHDIASKWKTLG
jgi:phosphoribosylamine---glycine ligase